MLLASCHKNVEELDPYICYNPQKAHIQTLKHPFPPLDERELFTDWGKEMRIAETFAIELDLYRAITTFRRARALLPLLKKERRNQIDYSIMLCYYLGNKYCDVIEVFNESKLDQVPDSFPAFRNLMIILYDSFYKTEQFSHAERILELLDKYDQESAIQLELSASIQSGDIQNAMRLDSNQEWLYEFCHCRKSPRTAQTLNALLPGAGYLYVGQKKSAFTSFALNSLFIWAAWNFFDKGHTAAGIVTTSLEFGWYAGGINGGGLAAKAYNDSIYSEMGKEEMLCQKLFPVFHFEYAF